MENLKYTINKYRILYKFILVKGCVSESCIYFPPHRGGHRPPRWGGALIFSKISIVLYVST